MSHLKSSVRILYALLVALLCAGFTLLPPAAPTNLKVLVVFLKLSPPFCSTPEACLPDFGQDHMDSIHAPRSSAALYEGMLNYTMSSFIKEATFNNASVVFDSLVNPDSPDGWFDAPHSLEEYNNPNGGDPPAAEAYMGRDAYDLARSEMGDAVDDYDILLVINNIQMLYGFKTAQDPYDSLVVAGENVDNESLFEVLGHELGHALLLEHVVMDSYDIVGNSPVLVHYGGWSKVFAGWVPEITDMPCLNGPCEITTVLEPIKRPGNNVLRIPFIDLPGKHFLGYFVECRAHLGFDAKIPEEGVIITSINATASFDEAARLVYTGADGDVSDAALSPGEVYVDEDQLITISYISKDGLNNCTVKAERGPLTAPDPRIISGSEASSGAGYTDYTSRDIWIDSLENGWDVYPFGEYFSLEGDQSVPAGYGDPFWVGHENRIKFLVRNAGFGPAENVIVDVYVTQPIIINIPGITCDGPELNKANLVATVEIDHLEQDEIYFGSVPYTPSTNAAAQVKVVIRDYPGEITHKNNTASETYAPHYVIADIMEILDIQDLFEAVETSAGSVFVQTQGACPHKYPYRFVRKVISAIDKKYWVMDFDNFEIMDVPEEGTEVRLASLPPEGAQPGDCFETLVEAQVMPDDVYVPLAGFTYQTCVVAPSTLTCSAPKETQQTGSQVVISGGLTPAPEGGAIALEFTSPKGDAIIQNAQLKKDGSYELAYLPEVSGSWQVQAFWQGSSASAPARSEVCAFEIASDQPEFTLNHNINCRLGPGTDYDVVISGRIGDVIPVEARSADSLWLYGLMKGRHCWMSLELGDLNVNPFTLPKRAAPALKPKVTLTPVKCSNFKTKTLCLSHEDKCTWSVTPGAIGVCKSK